MVHCQGERLAAKYEPGKATSWDFWLRTHWWPWLLGEGTGLPPRRAGWPSYLARGRGDAGAFKSSCWGDS